MLVPAGIPPRWLGGQDCVPLSSLTPLPGCSPSPAPCSARTGYALLPSKALQAAICLPSLRNPSGCRLSPRARRKSEEPGFPVGLEEGCGSEPASAGAEPGWVSAGDGFPNPSFPCASQRGFPAQALLEHPQPSPAHPGSATNPTSKQADLQPAKTDPWQLSSSPILGHGGG